MTPCRLALVLVLLVCSPRWVAAAPATRPNLNDAQPIAACSLQQLANTTLKAPDPTALRYPLQPTTEDPLADYQRTPLGGWHMPAAAERSDPWLRLMLLAPQRPVLIDLAVFIDGKPFRDVREASIDSLVAGATQPESVDDARTGNNSDRAAGTNSADTASEANPPHNVTAQARPVPTMRERLLNYLAAKGDNVDRDEIDWLLAEWGAGPAIVVLGQGIAWERAGAAPLLVHLDQNNDGALSATEIAQADERLASADADGNDVVDLNELRRAADRPLSFARPTGHPLVVLLDANTDWDTLTANLTHVYGGAQPGADNASPATTMMSRIARGDATFTGAQLADLCAEPADFQLRIDFGVARSDSQQPRGMSVLARSNEATSTGADIVAANDTISFDLGGDYVEISAAQSPVVTAPEAVAGQLAIGAVIDGFPLERVLDHDQDGRFTRRERQALAGLLTAIDRNQDGQVAADEVPVPLRLAVTLGADVHRLLSQPTGAARTIAAQTTSLAPPDWFLGMDKNGDRDLSRTEFLGTFEQFRKLDADRDGLLSVAEATKPGGGQ